MSAPTPQQLAAITARGNALVAAGAGTGKTSTVVARCLQLVLEENCSLGEILMVTFTEAAAAEMRARIRESLSEKIATAPSVANRLAEELALLDHAPISTLHGFCLELVRRHFHKLGLDPQFSVLDEQQSKPLLHATLDELFQRHYAAETPLSANIRDLIRSYGDGRDEKIRGLVWKIHQHSQTLPSPERWLQNQIAAFENPTPESWRKLFTTAVRDWGQLWSHTLSPVAHEHPNLTAAHAALAELGENFYRTADALGKITAADAADWKRKKTQFHKPYEAFFEDARFLATLAQTDGIALAEDWNWTRQPMLALLRLAQEFTLDFSRAKRELGGIDFADQEQFALRLLVGEDGQPTPVAFSCREQFRFVFVDECQDINAAQDAILRAVGGENKTANRFLVGDVKQSIYRFRLADPRIFQHYEKSWPQCLPLAENFRSREALLHFINSLFRTVMRPAIGGLHYDANAELQFGNAAGRAQLALATETAARTELHVITKDSDREAEESDGDIAELQTTEREARLVAHRFSELKKSGYLVWNKTEKKFLPVEFRDMVVLLRGVAGRAEVFAKEFHRADIPFHAARAGFLDTLEVTDLLNLLKLLDNPLQDVPLLAVLRSPLVALTPDELAEIRISGGRDLFWTAVQNSKLKTQNSKLAAKLQNFLTQFAAWRELARHSSVTHCLETALAATHYEALLLADERGAARVANVRRFVELARRFDPYQREGLFRFLQFIAAQEEAEVRHEPAAVAAENAVRLMTIHSSKGLEFPIVAVAGLGWNFNLLDLRADILLDEEFGLCPRVQPPGARSRYPSIAHWAATQRERRALLGEEMRLLYVALTRARDHLILVGSATRTDEVLRWHESSALNDHALLKSNHFLTWLRLWFTQQGHDAAWRNDHCGEKDFVRWEFHDALAEVFSAGTAKNRSIASDNILPPTAKQLAAIKTTVAWNYPHAAARSEPAKTSVSVLRRRLITDDEATTTNSHFAHTVKAPGQLSAVESGTAHHKFLQLLTLERTDTELDLRNQANGFLQTGILSAEEFAVLDFVALTDFWQSDFGQRVRRAPAQCVHRELPFTARMTSMDLRDLDLLPEHSELPADEFVTVQGAVDLAVIFPGKEIWLVDFKTDAVDETELDARTEKYRQQLLLYARALARIYRTPVRDCRLHFLKLRRAVAIEV